MAEARYASAEEVLEQVQQLEQDADAAHARGERGLAQVLRDDASEKRRALCARLAGAPSGAR